MHEVTPPDDGRRRVVVLAVRPQVDGGRAPIKRVVGERVDVEADVVVDGHDLLQAVLLHAHEGDAAWQELPLAPAGNDVWRASFAPDRLGRHRYSVLAWVDRFATWRHGLDRKLAAGVDVTVELLEGAALVDEA
ncbi:MAG TPA: maltotransferase domain-containing protein, partial [Kofleriaceae bacterium]|nr:maltotransferase domain-containing protein [Kofleriaceae bacterium]